MPVVWCPLLILNIVVMSEHVWHSKVLLVSSSKLSRSPSGRDSRAWPSACIGPAVQSPGDDSKDGIQPSGGDSENIIVQPPGDDSENIVQPPGDDSENIVQPPGGDSENIVQPPGDDSENLVQPPGDDSRDCNLVSWRGKQ
jgi:hypothetical protein